MHEPGMKKKRIATEIVHSLWMMWESCGGLCNNCGLLSPRRRLVISLG